MKALSLFTGAGGADLGLEAAGIEVVAMCENAPHARAVLRYRYPNIPLHDDVTTLDGTQFKGVDLVVGGSPCQDLSVAGKRGGMGGARSGLFHHQARIWRETEAPYLIWENVAGALSSPKKSVGTPGADFAIVLSTLVGRAVAIPRSGWERGGVASGPAAVAAWYVFNLEHFGVPQSRDRIAVVAARAGGVDPAEVLALGPRVRGDSAPRFEARERTTAAPESGTGTSRGGGYSVARPLGAHRSGGNCLDGPAFPVNAPCECGHAKVSHSYGIGHCGGVAGSGPVGKTGRCRCKSFVRPVGISVAVRGRADASMMEMRLDGIASALRAPGGGSSRSEVIAHTLRGEGFDASEDGTGRGTPLVIGPVNGEVASTVCENTRNNSNPGVENFVIGVEGGGIAPTLRVGGREQGAGSSHDNTPRVVALHRKQNPISDDHISPALGESTCGMGVGIEGLGVRMLTPVECERISSLPDDWTKLGIDEKGRAYELKDSPRYQLCGNLQAPDWGQWLYTRLVKLENGETP